VEPEERPRQPPRLHRHLDELFLDGCEIILRRGKRGRSRYHGRQEDKGSKH
jgi:hypothetical protein